MDPDRLGRSGTAELLAREKRRVCSLQCSVALSAGMETFAADMDMVLNSRQVYDTIAQRVFLEMAEERAKVPQRWVSLMRCARFLGH